MDSGNGLFSTATVLTLNTQGIQADTLHMGLLGVIALLVLVIAYSIRSYMRYQTVMNVIAAVVIAAGVYQVWRFDGYVRAFISVCDETCQKVITPETVAECRRNIVQDFGRYYVQWRAMPFGGIFDGIEYNKEAALLTLYSTRLKVGDYNYDATCALDTTLGTVLMATYNQQEVIVPVPEQSVAE